MLASIACAALVALTPPLEAPRSTRREALFVGVGALVSTAALAKPLPAFAQRSALVPRDFESAASFPPYVVTISNPGQADPDLFAAEQKRTAVVSLLDKLSRALNPQADPKAADLMNAAETEEEVLETPMAHLGRPSRVYGECST